MKSNIHKPDKGWVVMELFKIEILSILISVLFYDSVLVSLFVLPAGILLWKQDIYLYIEGSKEKMRDEFKNVIIKVSGNLNAGYSLENAFIQASKDTEKETSGYMGVELKKLVAGLTYNKRIEDMLMEIGTRSEIDEIKEFAGLIVIAKSYGGNIINLIRQTAGNLSERQSVALEINTLTAAKRLEGNIMVMMPFVIIVFMRFTNEGYMDVLYETLLGRVIMTVCLVLVIFSWVIINKIMKIN